jgi:hypothetical protein
MNYRDGPPVVVRSKSLVPIGLNKSLRYFNELAG